MKMTIDMPLVSQCAIGECAYNVDNTCHARAITIGDGIHPGCDTFLGALPHTREGKRAAGVGACKVTACTHNDDYECMAEQIAVGYLAEKINCLTYSPR